VDANAAYSVAEAIPLLRKMETYKLSLIEQPVPLWDFDGLSKVADALDTPILVCESARLPENVMNLAKYSSVDMVNIKIGRTRGFVGAKKMEAVSEAAGFSICVGTMMELGVGTIAAAQFAASVRTLADTCDFTGPSLLVDDIITEPIIIQDGYLYLPEAPGLGVELDEEKLRYYQVK
jgi:muconate cycloisomerase